MYRTLLTIGSLLLATGCGSDTPAPAGSSGGATGASSGGAANSGGASGSGGAPAGGSPAMSSGGMASASGGMASASGGVANASGGMASTSGGMATSSGGTEMGSGGMEAAGGSAMTSVPKPSAGCSAGNSTAQIPNALLDLPNGYDGMTPVPLVLALHANGNPNTQLQGAFGSEGKSRGYMLVYPKSAGGGWDVNAGDLDRVNAAYDAVLQNYCVDENRVYGTGHSGGAQTLTQMLCRGDDRFRAVAPVASSRYCNGWDAVAALVIHGICDQERGGSDENPDCPLPGGNAFADKYGVRDVDGAKDFDVYKSSNMCGDQSMAFTPGGNCGGSIDPGCVEYQGCAARTLFCNHNDPQYSGTNHGIPCFASKAIFDFFDEEM